MPGLRAAIVLLLLAACDSKPSAEIETPPTRRVRAVASTQSLPPWPAGEVRAPTIQIEFAVYGLPGGAQNVELAAAAVVQEHRSTLLPLPATTNPATARTVVLQTPPVADFPAPLSDMLEFHGRGLTPAEVSAVQSAPKVARLLFNADGDSVSAVYAEAVAMVAEIAKRSGGLAWDQHTQELFSRERWQQRLAAETGGVLTTKQFSVQSYPVGEYVRVVTHGLGKFGLPDIVVNQVPTSSAADMSRLVNMLALALHENSRLEQAGVFALSGEQLVRLELGMGRREEGDPVNRLIEVGFPGQGELATRQIAAIDGLFGAGPEKVAFHAIDDPELSAATAVAREQLRVLAPRFANGSLGNEVLMVKAPFDTHDGGVEWMWVEVTSWRDGVVRGLLQNIPEAVPGLRLGAKVEVAWDSLSDYLHTRADGSQAGNLTGEILMRRRGMKE